MSNFQFLIQSMYVVTSEQEGEKDDTDLFVVELSQ